MDDNFIIIAITAPGIVKGEADRICEILHNNEADIVHIRKPNWDIRQTATLLNEIPAQLHPRLKIHDHFSLLGNFRIGGVHLNSRNKHAPENVASVSCSFHSLSQLPLSYKYDYVTLSPIFDSISKAGYKSPFSLQALKPLLDGKRIIALGGVTPEKFQTLKEVGFRGAAMLGYFWNRL